MQPGGAQGMGYGQGPYPGGGMQGMGSFPPQPPFSGAASMPRGPQMPAQQPAMGQQPPQMPQQMRPQQMPSQQMPPQQAAPQMAPPPQQAPQMAPPQGAAPQGAPAQPSPLLRIRAGIEAGNPQEVLDGVRQADSTGVVLAPNVREMITQWLSVNAPQATAAVAKPAPAPAQPANTAAADAAVALIGGQHAAPSPAVRPAPPPTPARPPAPAEDHEDKAVQRGGGSKGWSSTARSEAAPPPGAPRQPPPITPEALRKALLKFFEGAPTGSDAAAGLGIMEGESGARFLPLPLLGRAVGLSGQDFEVADAMWRVVNDAPAGMFTLSPDARGAGLFEWAGWEEFQSSLSTIVTGTRDPAFEPRSIQGAVANAARGAVRAGHVRQADVLRSLRESLSPQDMPEDVAPALRSAISRRTRLALACLVDAIAAVGLGPEAGPDSMGLVGQLPRTLFGLIFDRMDDRDRGACAFLGEVLQSWDKRRCFSKRWLQDAASKFSMPKGPNPEKDEGRGWYALTAENLHKKPAEDKPAAKDKSSDGDALPPVALSLADEPDVPAPKEKESRRHSRSPKRRGSSPRARKSPRRSPPRSRSGATPAEPEVAAPPPRESPRAPAAAAPEADTGPSADEALERLVAKEREAERQQEAALRADKTGKKKRGIVQDEEDDDAVNRHLEESRKRRAALMAKYKEGKD
mmetsp:Transcript_34570/g.99227  ORF Transcript_34570/g.99227 Transcript_34570/m.99227 type:complete len:689 (+) Transcript_34570:70-2136(+)